jgi:DNA-binding NarL/FixJ family response regulator
MPPSITQVIIAKAPGRLCEGLRLILENQPWIKVIGIVHDDKTLFKLINQFISPNIILIDVDFSNNNILTLYRQLKQEAPKSGCILLVETLDQKVQAFSAGSNDVLIKGYSVDDLLSSIQLVKYSKSENSAEIKFQFSYGNKREIKA